MLELKEDKGTDYYIGWKSKGICASKLTPLYTALLHSIKLSGYRIRIQFNNSVLVVEQNDFATKDTDTFIVYDLDDWLKIPLNYFKLKNCSFVASNMIKNSNKGKWVYSGYGTAFDGAGSWNFGNDVARNIVTLGVDNSSSSYTDNRKNNFLVLGKGRTDYINDSVSAAEQKFIINFSKEKIKVCLILHYNHGNSYLFVKRKKSISLK